MDASLKIDFLTLFPNMLSGFLGESMLARAQEAGILELNVHNIRDWSTSKHKNVDDRPFGGGPGMLLMPEPIFAAIEELQSPECTRIYMCPDGEKLSPQIAAELAQKKHLIILSGHYEGIDQRVRDCVIDREISIGDYVLTNGTLPAAVLADTVARYVKGVLGEENSLTFDSFNDNLLSFPQYTRPANFRGMEVPAVLMSGNHAEIQRWRRQQQVEKTKQRRQDILKSKEKQ
ncbi:MAG: tRNA (guanosine(37)-N1)-methyltransferase TrmD [Verrucomicrobiaceae bacterium]|nr:tRNA (guanosine(37)-N1)-methyltransferase TrmD [Verrucomicrobiaceae bacterium]